MAGHIGRLSALDTRRRNKSCGSIGGRLQGTSAIHQILLSESFCAYRSSRNSCTYLAIRGGGQFAFESIE